MYIQTLDMRNEFIRGLSVNFPYASALPSKSIAVKSDILFAAKNLYAYGTPFWTRGGQRHYNTADIPMLISVLDPFVDMVWGYFRSPAPSTQADFDVIHKRMCDEFLNNIAAAGRYTHTYGNSQKMVNVLFKYLACFHDAPTYEEWFKYCHMALDGYTYRGYRLPFYSKVVYPTIHGHSAPGLAAWSNIATLSDYQVIVDDIVSYVSSHPLTYNDYLNICAHFPVLTTIPHLAPLNNFVCTPFEAEFFLWVIAKACAETYPTGGYVYPNALVSTIRRLL